jgi:hypothetical protein
MTRAATAGGRAKAANAGTIADPSGQARRRTMIAARGAGAFLLLVGALLANALYDRLAIDCRYADVLPFISCACMLCGTIFVVLGAAGAARFRDLGGPYWGLHGAAIVSSVFLGPLVLVSQLASFAGCAQ